MPAQKDDPVVPTTRVNMDDHAPGFSKAMSHLDNAAAKELERVSFPAGLADLVRLRASQLNGCAYCVDMHTTEAMDNGESIARVAAVGAWHESGLFTARERAALLFAEDVTRMAERPMPESTWAAVAEQYQPDEIAALLALIVTINAWNALAVTSRTWSTAASE